MANLTNSAKLIEEMEKKVNSSSLATVATSGSYTDLSNKPTIPTVNDSTITVQKNGANVDSFTTNAAAGKTINIQLTKADVGLGSVDNTSDANKPISNATQTALNAKADANSVYTKAEVDSAISSAVSSVYKYKGSVANYASLPTTELTVGDVYNVEDTGDNYAWTGTAWDQLGASVDLSNYLAKNNTTSFTPTGDYQPATKKYVDDHAGTEYNAGQGISIGDISINGRKGPSPDGFHIPSTTERQGLKTIMDGLSLTTGDNWRVNLHLPFDGFRDSLTADLTNQDSRGYYWSSSPYGTGYPNIARRFRLDSSDVYANDYIDRAYGLSVRCFKDSFEIPTSSWTVITGTLGSAGIFWNQTEGLISITSDGTTGYTIADKNLGATTVYNNGDTLVEANMGNMYQWGNNYGFPSTGTISNTSSTQVDASGYGPSTANGYYESDTFITGSVDWSSVQNDDLRGDTTGTITQENVISNTGVLSVNGQTGNVTIVAPDVSNYLAKDNTIVFTPSGDYNPATKKYVDDNKGTKVELVTQAQYDNIGSEKLTNGVLYGIIES